MNKVIYKLIRTEYYNGEEIDQQDFAMSYDYPPDFSADGQTIFKYTDYDEFIKALQKFPETTDIITVKTPWYSNKPALYITDGYDFYKVPKRHFKSYEVKYTYEILEPSFETIWSSLTAEEFIEWCKNHNIIK